MRFTEKTPPIQSMCKIYLSNKPEKQNRPHRKGRFNFTLEDVATADNNNEIFFVSTKTHQESKTDQTKKSNILPDDEEQESQVEEIAKNDIQAEK